MPDLNPFDDEDQPLQPAPPGVAEALKIMHKRAQDRRLRGEPEFTDEEWKQGIEGEKVKFLAAQAAAKKAGAPPPKAAETAAIASTAQDADRRRGRRATVFSAGRGAGGASAVSATAYSLNPPSPMRAGGTKLGWS